MTDNDMEVAKGTGNLFRDLGMADSDLLQAKAILAAQIIKTLEARQLTARAAQAETGFAEADFSRIRKANLARFTLDRLMTILGRLDQDMEVSISLRNRLERPSATAITHAL